MVDFAENYDPEHQQVKPEALRRMMAEIKPYAHSFTDMKDIPAFNAPGMTPVLLEAHLEAALETERGLVDAMATLRYMGDEKLAFRIRQGFEKTTLGEQLDATKAALRARYEKLGVEDPGAKARVEEMRIEKWVDANVEPRQLGGLSR